MPALPQLLCIPTPRATHLLPALLVVGGGLRGTLAARWLALALGCMTGWLGNLWLRRRCLLGKGSLLALLLEGHAQQAGALLHVR